MPIRSKIEPAKVSASEWQNPGQALRGLLEGKDLHTNITLIRYVTDVVGEGPTLHVHPYDEIFTITEGRARFTVGDKTIDAETGDVVLGPANIPHGYQNLGPGRLDSLDIHLSPEWIQFDLASAWDKSSVLVSADSKVKPDRSPEGINQLCAGLTVGAVVVWLLRLRNQRKPTIPLRVKESCLSKLGSASSN
jgi:mannose-6-phosphate isomerase-like protein (cupin superfamily)